MATIKKQQKISVDRNVKKKKMEPLCTLGRSVVKWCSHFNNMAVSQTQSPRENNMAVSQTIKITSAPEVPAVPKVKAGSPGNTCTPMLRAALFTITKKEKQLKYPLVDGWINKMWCV